MCSFRRIWENKFPKLKVVAKGEDACADCYFLKLKLDRIAREKDQLLDGLAVLNFSGVRTTKEYRSPESHVSIS